jgi:hypothetical protein
MRTQISGERPQALGACGRSLRHRTTADDAGGLGPSRARAVVGEGCRRGMCPSGGRQGQLTVARKRLAARSRAKRPSYQDVREPSRVSLHVAQFERGFVSSRSARSSASRVRTRAPTSHARPRSGTRGFRCRVPPGGCAVCKPPQGAGRRCHTVHRPGVWPMRDGAVYAETADTPIPFMGCSFRHGPEGDGWKLAPRRATWRGGQDGHSEDDHNVGAILPGVKLDRRCEPLRSCGANRARPTR